MVAHKNFNLENLGYTVFHNLNRIIIKLLAFNGYDTIFHQAAVLLYVHMCLHFL